MSNSIKEALLAKYEEFGDEASVIEFAQENLAPKYPEGSAKTAENIAAWRKENNEFNDAVLDFMFDCLNADGKVPDYSKPKVIKLAWDYGHSGGFSEVHGYMSDLVDLF